LVIGLLIGWVFWPVQWENATIFHLRPDLQEEWVRMTVDSYAIGATEEDTRSRLDELGPIAPQVIEEVRANPGNTLTQNALEEIVEFYYQGGGVEEPGPEPDAGVTPAEETAQPGGSGLSGLVLACAFTVLLGFALALVLFLRRRSRGPVEATPAMQAQEFSSQAPRTDYAAMGQDAPIAQWMTTYLKGDDLFDDSFSIDAPTGEFMGECGVGIADTIGVGEPKRVSAFEVWLFDKNDIQTVTKVVMSEHLFNDEASYNRLAAKGEPMNAAPGAQITLETETLQMVVRVVDMAYGEGALPDHSFFERVTLELSIWKKM
jgi:hypothetical protein